MSLQDLKRHLFYESYLRVGWSIPFVFLALSCHTLLYLDGAQQVLLPFYALQQKDMSNLSGLMDGFLLACSITLTLRLLAKFSVKPLLRKATSL